MMIRLKNLPVCLPVITGIALALSTSIAATAAPDSKAKLNEPSQPDQPNIVIYMIDDLGWNQISAAKATMGTHTGEFQTPHLEKLAKNGDDTPFTG